MYARDRLARISDSGSVESFAPSFNNNVYAVAVQSDGKIVVGGAFTNANGTAKYYLARLNSDGTLDSGFNGGGLNGAVRTVALGSDGKIYIGGDFTQAGGQYRYYIARLSTNGVIDSFAINPDGAIYSQSVNSSNYLAIGGNFNYIGSYIRKNVGVLNSDGTVYSTFAPNPGANSYVNSVFLTSGGQVWLGGAFTQVNSTSRDRLARLDADGSLLSMTSPLHDNEVLAVVPHDTGVLVGGIFTWVNGMVRECATRFTSTGGMDTTYDFGDFFAYPPAVHAIAVDSSGNILLGGTFLSSQGSSRTCLARYVP